MKKVTLAAIWMLMLLLCFSGCSNSEDKDSQSSNDGTTSNATLFISSGDYFQELPVQCQGDLTPEFLLSSISDATGWNLDLSKDIVWEDGSMTVSFAETSALVIGVPESDNPFSAYDTPTIIRMILDSVQSTLQNNFVASAPDGSPVTLKVYFSLNGGDIKVPGTGIVISHKEPYEGF